MAELPKFKGQPWVLYDTVASPDFRLGSATSAIGDNKPAVSASGEISFFNAPGRNTGTTPWYTNLDLPGQLSYGMEVWAIYVLFSMPAFVTLQTITELEEDGEPGPPPPVKLVEALLHYSVLEMNLGQENQAIWPTTRFGAGGGMFAVGTGFANAQNSLPQGANVMVLPEPIEMPRTQNLFAKIRLAPEVFNIIGRATAAGVGAPLGDYRILTVNGETPTYVNLDQPPYSVQLGLIGRRIKDTQYGQLAPGQRA